MCLVRISQNICCLEVLSLHMKALLTCHSATVAAVCYYLYLIPHMVYLFKIINIMPSLIIPLSHMGEDEQHLGVIVYASHEQGVHGMT